MLEEHRTKLQMMCLLLRAFITQLHKRSSLPQLFQTAARIAAVLWEFAVCSGAEPLLEELSQVVSIKSLCRGKTREV